MGLPALLAPGTLSIYNLGQTGVADIVLPPLDDQGNGLTFGQVNQIWNNMPMGVNRWASVMFYTNDIIASLVYQNVRYVIINENKVLLTEIPIP